jgi:hypothetical protein
MEPTLSSVASSYLVRLGKGETVPSLLRDLMKEERISKLPQDVRNKLSRCQKPAELEVRLQDLGETPLLDNSPAPTPSLSLKAPSPSPNAPSGMIPLTPSTPVTPVPLRLPDWSSPLSVAVASNAVFQTPPSVPFQLPSDVPVAQDDAHAVTLLRSQLSQFAVAKIDWQTFLGNCEVILCYSTALTESFSR